MRRGLKAVCRLKRAGNYSYNDAIDSKVRTLICNEPDIELVVIDHLTRAALFIFSHCAITFTFGEVHFAVVDDIVCDEIKQSKATNNCHGKAWLHSKFPNKDSCKSANTMV